MKYCKKCVQPDTRPNIVFDEDGVCMACRYQEEMDTTVDWKMREEELKEIAEWAKERSSPLGFDCTIGVSGGRDSHFQALYAKERLGLKPLLVTNAPDGQTEWGRANVENLLKFGFDLVSIRANPLVMAAATKKGFYKYGSPVKASEYSLWASAYTVALNYDVPLVIQGENPVITLGISGGEMKPDGDARKMYLHNTLAGGDASEWVEPWMDPRDAAMFQFPAKELMASDIKAVFLNYYAKEWSYTNNTEFAVARGLRGNPHHTPMRTGKLSPYTSVDTTGHSYGQMLKYYKFGFGFITDEVCYMIREGRMTRDEAIPLVEMYDGKCDEEYIWDFCRYIGITIPEFYRVRDQWVNKDLFKRGPDGKWIPKFKVGLGLLWDLSRINEMHNKK